MTFCRRARLEFQIWNIALRPESNIAPPPAFQSISFVLKTSQHILLLASLEDGLAQNYHLLLCPFPLNSNWTLYWS